jgi:septal ring-binding cell division protein DamX
VRRYLAHLAKFVEGKEVFVYRTEVNDTPHLGVAYGSFSTRRAARAALAKLPIAIRSDRPYVRSVSGIRPQDMPSP